MIESHYAGDVAENLAYARRCVLDCLKRGEAPYASHLFFTQDGLLDDADPEQRRLGIEAGLAWGRSADLVAVYIDRGVSRGMREGISAARLRGAQVEFQSLERAVDSTLLESLGLLETRWYDDSRSSYGDLCVCGKPRVGSIEGPAGRLLFCTDHEKDACSIARGMGATVYSMEPF